MREGSGLHIAREEMLFSEKVQSQVGAVTARSSRPGVAVFLDGAAIGSTPVTKGVIPSGRHVLEWRVNGHPACTRTVQVEGAKEHTFDCEAPTYIYRARLSDRDHHNSKGVRLLSADGIVRQDRAWVHRYDKADPEDEPDPVFKDGKMRGKMERMLKNSLSADAMSRILNDEPLIEVWIWEQRLDVRFVE